jgi:hypothetical protein
VGFFSRRSQQGSDFGLLDPSNGGRIFTLVIDRPALQGVSHREDKLHSDIKNKNAGQV